MTQRERENFYRNSTVIVDHGKEILSAVLENDLSNTNLTFEDFINKHLHDIYHLCYNKIPCCQCPGGRFVPANQNRILYPDQLDILLDIGGSTLNGHNPNTSRTSQYCCRPAKRSLSTSHLDITLLRCLLVNFAQNCRTNSILRQDVEDLVKCRNTLYAHAEEAKLTNSDYANHKIDVESIIRRIARFCNIENEMQEKLNDVSQRPLDETLLMQYQTTLMQQSLQDRDVEKKVDQLEQHLTLQDDTLYCRLGILEGKIGDVDYGKRNIISHTEACLLEHSKDDTYVITKDVKQCCDILDKHNILVIIAKAGGGKSKTSIQIAMMYKEQKYIPMLFLNNEITRKRELVNFNENNIIIVDNLFDESNIDRYLNEDLYRGILDVLYSCCKAESCKSKLIITVRGNNQIQMKLNESHQIFENEVIINLDEKRSLHSNELILSKHMNRHGISLCQCKKVTNIRSVFFPAEVNPQCKSSVSEMKDTSLQVCVSLFNEICSGKYDIHIGFPEVCNLFCSNKNITKLGIEYFTHASQSLVKEIKKLKKQGFDNRNMQYQYCVLVYTSIKSSIDVDDIDKNCFQNILSNYENNKIIISLLKEAVRRLDGTYLIKQSSSESSCNNSKRRKVSEIYVLQHFTVKEAILITYGEDVDILSFCDFRVLFEYIRPRGYKFSTSDHMVHHLTDYKLLAKKLISVLSTDDCTCISVGVYLQKVGLMQSDDKLIPFFFEILEDVKPDQYVCLLNGLTNLGKNAHLIKFHPQLCTKIINNGGWIVFLASHRPIGWSYDDTNFFEIETKTLIEKLIFMMTLNRFNGKDPNSEENERKCHPLSSLSTFVNYHYAIGNYVFENLIAKGFIDTAEILLIAITQKEHEINPIHIKEFLDGLLDRGKRASVVSKFKGFFESVLFKYGSILTVLQLCRPLTSNITDSNILLVDDNLLTGKLSAHLESTFGDKSDLKQTVPRESGAYFVHWDYNYFQMRYIDDIARFVLEHGVKVSNDKFVRTMFEKLVSYTPRIEETFHAGRFELESLFQNEDEEDVAIAKTIVLDDYPDEKIEDENGSVVYSNLKDIFVRRVYQEHCILFGPTYHRLFEFLSFLMVRWFTNEDSKYELMTILREKFVQLFYITRVKDMFCEFDSHDSDGSF